MGRLIVGRQEAPIAPYECREAVEQYAREHGRTGRLVLAPGGWWVARFELKPNDPRMRQYQEFGGEEPPAEQVIFSMPKRGGQPWERVPVDIEALGPTGIRQYLERGNTWSGRGEYRSQEDAVRKTEEHNREQKQKNFREGRESFVREMVDKRRSRFKIPFLGVGIDLRRKSTKE